MLLLPSTKLRYYGFFRFQVPINIVNAQHQTKAIVPHKPVATSTTTIPKACKQAQVAKKPAVMVKK